MKTAGRKPTNATRLSAASRAFWSGKREQILLDNKRGWKSTKIRPKVKCFLLTSPLIEHCRHYGTSTGLPMIQESATFQSRHIGTHPVLDECLGDLHQLSRIDC